MKQGDFSLLAKEYINRTGYSSRILMALLKYINGFEKNSFIVADVGAGTGKLTENLIDLDRKSTRLNSSHIPLSRMPSSA